MALATQPQHPGKCQRHAASVDGDPAPAPLLRDVNAVASYSGRASTATLFLSALLYRVDLFYHLPAIPARREFLSHHP